MNECQVTRNEKLSIFLSQLNIVTRRFGVSLALCLENLKRWFLPVPCCLFMVGIGGQITTLKLIPINIDLLLIKPRTKHMC